MPINKRDINNIIVVGGGTAGWLTALYAKSIFPNKNITLIESEEIGILGAGEGTVPHFIDLLDFLNIPFTDLIKNANATMKNGIKFTNWNNDGKHYYHAFGLFSDSGLGIAGCNLNPFSSSLLNAIVTASSRDKSSDDIEIYSDISEKNKVPLILKENLEKDINPILKYNAIGYWAAHFDAAKVAEVLRSYAEKRGVKRIEGIVSDLILNEFDEVSKIILSDSTEIESDFVFDCTGFNRLIIGKKYNGKWKSHSDKLPVNRALPFFLPVEEQIPAYTESIAMKYGWIWKIPLQHRYGCGYVFDSSLISDEEAAKEIEDMLGFEPIYPRSNKGSFKFNAGYYENPWINNCVAVGLSAGFIEPLEATSLWVTVMQLKMIFANSERMYIRDSRISDHYNKKFIYINDNVLSFVYFHYMTERKDTEFWKKFTYENAPEETKKIIDEMEFKLPEWDDFNTGLWSMHSWFEVASGIKKVNNDMSKFSEENSETQKFASRQYDFIKSRNIITSESCSDHRSVLNDLKEGFHEI